MKLVKFSRITNMGEFEVYVNAEQIAFIQVVNDELSKIAFTAPQGNELVAIDVTGSIEEVHDALTA